MTQLRGVWHAFQSTSPAMAQSRPLHGLSIGGLLTRERRRELIGRTIGEDKCPRVSSEQLGGSVAGELGPTQTALAGLGQRAPDLTTFNNRRRLVQLLHTLDRLCQRLGDL